MERQRSDAGECAPALPTLVQDVPAPAHNVWIDLLLYPTHSAPTAAAPVLVGLGLAGHDGVFAPVPALVGLFGTWLIHIAGLFTDNHELLRRYPQLPEHPELTRAVADGTLKLSSLRAAVATCLLLTLLTVPYLYRIGGTPVLVLGVIGVASSLWYHGAPWSYVKTGLADPLFVVMFGIVGVVGTYFIQVAAVQGAPLPWQLMGSLPGHVFVVGLPAGAIVASVMLVDDMRDHEFDRLKGWRTGTVRFGIDFTRKEITLLVAFAYLAPLLYWVGLGFQAWVLLPLLSLPLAWRTLRAVHAATRRTDLHPISPRMAGLATLHSALLAIGLILSR